ncbi:MAG: hypothetical protein EBS23_01825 [Betaproteobacteria bacterium]|nr:hypothetical protein [Betaproteobacteria bacterium]
MSLTRRPDLPLRDAFSRSAGAAGRPLRPKLLLVRPLPFQHAYAQTFTREHVAHRLSRPSWSDIAILVLLLATVTTCLIFILLERSARALNRQMELISLSRESSSPVTRTGP